MVTVEDHYFEGKLYTLCTPNFSFYVCLSPMSVSPGGLGEGVAAAVAEDGGVKVHRLAVTGIPRSGPAALLMEDYGISANCIVKAVKSMLA